MNQIFLNLLGNAIKFTEAGGTITIRIVEKPCRKEGYGNYEFYVKDTGIGMSEEFKEHIFEPFERERTSTISGIQGTGLGMAIAKNIVDMMEGTIDVQSEEGKGTEFMVSLTFRLKSLRSPSPEIPELAEKAPRRRVGGRILLTEDNELNREIASELLEEEGFEIECAENGKIAVEMISRSKPGYYQVILMDIQMPVMNGYEATLAIRRLEDKELSAIPILAMTANAFEEDRRMALECGMNGHIAKPFNIGKLLEILDSIIQVEYTEGI